MHTQTNEAPGAATPEASETNNPTIKKDYLR